MALLFESMAIRDLRVLAGALGGAVSYFQTDDHEIDAVVSLPDRRWAGIEIELGGRPAIDQGATSVAAAAARKRLTGVGAHVGPMSPIAPNGVWALDFQFGSISCSIIGRCTWGS